LGAVDFFTAEVWTAAGLITDYVAHFHAERNREGNDNAIFCCASGPYWENFWYQSKHENASVASSNSITARPHEF